MADPLAGIMYGDGLRAIMYDEKNSEPNRNGVMVKPMLLCPSDEIKSKYDLAEDDLTIDVEDKGRRGMWVEYPVKRVRWLRQARYGATILIFCAFDGGKTDLMDFYEELIQFNEVRDKTEARLRSQVSYLQRELEDITSAYHEFLRKQKMNADIYSPKEESSEDD